MFVFKAKPDVFRRLRFYRCKEIEKKKNKMKIDSKNSALFHLYVFTLKVCRCRHNRWLCAAHFNFFFCFTMHSQIMKWIVWISGQRLLCDGWCVLFISFFTSTQHTLQSTIDVIVSKLFKSIAINFPLNAWFNLKVMSFTYRRWWYCKK